MDVDKGLRRGIKNWGIRFRNIALSKSNKYIGTSFHCVEVPGREELTLNIAYDLNKELDFETGVGSMITALKKIESNMEELGLIKKNIEELYFQIGPYTDKDIKEFESKIFNYGTTEYKEISDKKYKMKVDSFQPFEIRLNHMQNFKPMKIKIPIPSTTSIKYPSCISQKHTKEISHDLAIFGMQTVSGWFNYYGKYCREKIGEPLKEKLLEYWKEKYLDKDKDDQKKKIEEIKNIISINVDIEIEGFYQGINHMLQNYVIPKESAYYSLLNSEVEECLNKLNTLRDKIMQELIPEKVKYKHSFKVIKLYKYDYDFDKRKMSIKTFEQAVKDGEIKWEVLPGEASPGKDDYDMVLEVAEDGFEFNGKKYSEGEVILDIFSNRKPRKVPKEWMEWIDLLDLVSYLNNAWDEYRDDLRDGRYHPNSITAVDYAMAINPSMWGEWGKINPKKINDNYRKYTMNNGLGPVIKGKRKPTNLSPAFDKRALKHSKTGYLESWMHIGKKRYYGTNEHIMEVLDGDKDFYHPMISTRGASMYIIERVLSNMKTIDLASRTLRKIGDLIGGYDYGPRDYRDEFPTNPYDIKISDINNPPKKYKIPEILDWYPEAKKKAECKIIKYD
ncbi:MAG: hypothetical protein QF436_03720 [Candidatus Woesearchaeota archaeon]|jgi:hypothetical protein|nr:hypothetical protein [Candidatus Woesearchaeota archaeon]MDP7623196.1 hypothetical protein [Candidatus Woesearchaeota archaeon]HJN56817.1 hypothetical protein [Candidatus Woesearchaeota archaeon]|tara:strand:+ start:23913 stop:25763 length:1851 start_codon:yes stop_codon:yes gene_type:complete